MCSVIVLVFIIMISYKILGVAIGIWQSLHSKFYVTFVPDHDICHLLAQNNM